MHISHEAGILEDPLYFAGKDILQKMVMPMDAPIRRHIYPSLSRTVSR
jgi:argininosuccinate synthase